MSEIIISELKPEQWPVYKDIRLTALKTNPMAFSNTFEDASTYPDEKWQQQLTDGTKRNGCLYLFAFDGEEVVGMNGAYWVEKPVIRHVAEVFGVFVKPSHRGLGIGKKLMDAVISEVTKDAQFKKIKLGVTAGNIAALKLYESCGLTVVGTLKQELRFGSEYYDELLMEKILD